VKRRIDITERGRENSAEKSPCSRGGKTSLSPFRAHIPKERLVTHERERGERGETHLLLCVLIGKTSQTKKNVGTSGGGKLQRSIRNRPICGKEKKRGLKHGSKR